MKKIPEDYLKMHTIRTKRQLKSKRLINLRKLRKTRNEKIRKIRLPAKIAFIEAFKSIGAISVKKIRSRVKTIAIPKVFSLYDEPEEVLKTILEFSTISSFKRVNEVKINHWNCEKHDLVAEILLAKAASSLKSYRCRNGAKFKLRGTFPNNKRMSRLLQSIGVVKEAAADNYHLSEKDLIKIYRKDSDPLEKVNIFGKDKKTSAIEGFTKYLDGCIEHINACLNDDEKEKIDQYLGEVLGNAEEHSGKKLWYIYSYLDELEDSQLYCEIAIINLGKTIFESFEEKRNVPVVANKWQDYCQKHTGKFSEEELTLVYALQQNASSKLDLQSDRGQGTKYLIELFHHLGDECNRINKVVRNSNCSAKPKMLILSGRSMLKFDGTYRSSINSENKMEFTFNDKGDLNSPPDKNYVFSLKNGLKFPGTVIYIRFSLNEDDLVDSDYGH